MLLNTDTFKPWSCSDDYFIRILSLRRGIPPRLQKAWVYTRTRRDLLRTSCKEATSGKTSKTMGKICPNPHSFSCAIAFRVISYSPLARVPRTSHQLKPNQRMSNKIDKILPPVIHKTTQIATHTASRVVSETPAIRRKDIILIGQGVATACSLYSIPIAASTLRCGLRPGF